MGKTIYIHIGAHKTGTSAIQQFLSMNRDNLRKKGFLYPGNHNAHHFIPHGLQKNTQVFSNPEEITKKVFDEIQKTNYENIIISSENLGVLKKKEISILKDKYLNDIGVKIVFYARRQDDYIESYYNQAVKGRLKYSKDISTYLSDYPKDHPDYYLILTRWKEIFGKDAIIVRVYEKEQIPNGLFEDFLTAVGLKFDDCYIFPGKKKNKSLNPDFTEIIRLCNTQLKEDPHINRYLIQKFEKFDMDEHSEKRRLLSPNQRHEIFELYKESNAKVAREYLGREDGRLFYSPLSDLNEPWEPYEGLTVEKVVPIFTQILYNMDVHYQRQFKNLGGNAQKIKGISKKLDESLKAIKRWIKEN